MNATLTGPFGGSACYRPREGPRQGCPRTARPAPARGTWPRRLFALGTPQGAPGPVPLLCQARPQSGSFYNHPSRPPGNRGGLCSPANRGSRTRGLALDPSPRPSPSPPLLCCSPPPRPRDPAMPLPAPLPLQPAEADAQAQRGPSGLTGKASRRRGGQLVSSSPAGTCRAVLGVSNLDGDRAARRLPPACVPRSGMPRVRAPGAAAQTPRTTRGPRGLGRAGQSPEAPDV